MSQCSQCFGIVKVGSPFGNLSLMSLFQSFVQSLIFRQGYCKNYLSYQNILYCVWKLTLSATTSYKNNCNTINGLWDICAERSAIALIIYFSRNIAKTIYHIITFLDSFESWSHQLQHIKKLLLYSQRFLRYSRRKIGDHREVPRADRFIKIYINHPQATCFHPVKFR